MGGHTRAVLRYPQGTPPIDYLTLGDVLRMHRELMAGVPAPSILLDEGQLESALQRPEHAAHNEQADIFQQAATLTAGVAQWHEGVLAPNGAVVAAMITADQARTVALAAPQPGALGRAVARGELPAWSRDGRVLYFVRRTPGPLLHLRDSLGNEADSQAYMTAVWQSRSAGRATVKARGCVAGRHGPAWRGEALRDTRWGLRL